MCKARVQQMPARIRKQTFTECPGGGRSPTVSFHIMRVVTNGRAQGPERLQRVASRQRAAAGHKSPAAAASAVTEILPVPAKAGMGRWQAPQARLTEGAPLFRWPRPNPLQPPAAHPTRWARVAKNHFPTCSFYVLNSRWTTFRSIRTTPIPSGSCRPAASSRSCRLSRRSPRSSPAREGGAPAGWWKGRLGHPRRRSSPTGGGGPPRRVVEGHFFGHPRRRLSPAPAEGRQPILPGTGRGPTPQGGGGAPSENPEADPPRTGEEFRTHPPDARLARQALGHGRGDGPRRRSAAASRSAAAASRTPPILTRRRPPVTSARAIAGTSPRWPSSCASSPRPTRSAPPRARSG